MLSRHPAIATAAVVARPDDRWGEVPCAFIELRAGHDPSAQDIIVYCRERLAGFECPKDIVFGALPTTATGKIQKFALRSKAHEA